MVIYNFQIFNNFLTFHCFNFWFPFVCISYICLCLYSKCCMLGESHVSITLALPQTWLPFMEFRHKKGDKSHLLKRCCLRVKCFIGRVVVFIISCHIFDL